MMMVINIKPRGRSIQTECATRTGKIHNKDESPQTNQIVYMTSEEALAILVMDGIEEIKAFLVGT